VAEELAAVCVKLRIGAEVQREGGILFKAEGYKVTVSARGGRGRLTNVATSHATFPTTLSLRETVRLAQLPQAADRKEGWVVETGAEQKADSLQSERRNEKPRSAMSETRLASSRATAPEVDHSRLGQRGG